MGHVHAHVHVHAHAHAHAHVGARCQGERGVSAGGWAGQALARTLPIAAFAHRAP